MTITCQICDREASWIPMTHPFVHTLAELLAEPAITEDDFTRLASAGEPVRRAAALLEVVPDDVTSLLATYEAALMAFHGPTPATLFDDAIAAAAELTAYRAADDEDGDAALSLILELDATVSVIVAAERTGRLPRGTADALAPRLESMLVGVSDRARHLAQLAEDRWLTVGDDPDLVGAYSWLDVLAEAAPSRSRIAAVVKAAAQHEHRIDDAMARLSRARPTRAR